MAAQAARIVVHPTRYGGQHGATITRDGRVVVVLMRAADESLAVFARRVARRARFLAGPDGRIEIEP